MEKTKKDVTDDQLNETPYIEEILKYIEKIEDFKHCEDEVRAASMLETYELSLDHVPGHLLKSKEVKCGHIKYFLLCHSFIRNYKFYDKN